MLGGLNSQETKCLNEEETNAPKNEERDMLCQEEFMFSLLACNVSFILDFNMQQLTLQTNAPLLKSAWHKSASLRDGMGCFEGQS